MRVFAPKPFVASVYRQLDARGELQCVTVLKVTLAHVQDAEAQFTRLQLPMCDRDTYFDDADPQFVPLVRPSDYVPNKPGTDVTFVGHSYAPKGIASLQWEAKLAIGPLSKTVMVHAPRRWVRVQRGMSDRLLGKGLGWQVAQPSMVDKMPLDWREAAGGWDDPDGTGDFDARNPIGRSDKPPSDDAADNNDGALPSITTQSGALAGFGPLAPFYQDRQCLAGTYDDDWLEHRHPLLPVDFDPGFWNIAPRDQIVRPHLTANSAYQLTNLSPEFDQACGVLPDLSPIATLTFSDGQMSAKNYVMELNDVQFDWREDHQIILVWRSQFALPDATMAQINIVPDGASVVQLQDRAS